MRVRHFQSDKTRLSEVKGGELASGNSKLGPNLPTCFLQSTYVIKIKFNKTTRMIYDFPKEIELKPYFTFNSLSAKLEV